MANHPEAHEARMHQVDAPVRVLLVDDDEAFVELAASFLRKGLIETVDGVCSGEEALSLIESDQYDLVICDYLMPEMDGVELLRKLRSSGNDIPFIMVTGKSKEDIAPEALQAGADFHVRKTGDIREQFTELSVTIRNLVNRKRAEEALRQANEKLSLIGTITRHDVINQIGILSGYLSLIEEDVDLATRSEHIKAAQQACRIMTEQLQFAGSYQKAGTKDPAWTRVKLELAGAASSIDLGSIKVNESLGDLEVLADPLFEKVFLNLLLNTRKHGVKATRVDVSCRKKGDSLLILYSDDGVGIPAGEKEKIFQRGYGKDTGLGLFLIREVLGITGMSIKEVGREGDGAVFEITVPSGRYRKASESCNEG